MSGWVVVPVEIREKIAATLRGKSRPLAEVFGDSYSPEPNSGCWLWIGSKWSCGYGRISRRGEEGQAHRLSWRLFHGPIPVGLFVCHTCDTPACVNPEHLFLGTSRDNALDAKHKGRLATGDKHGARLHPEIWQETAKSLRGRPRTPAQLLAAKLVLRHWWKGKHQSPEHIAKRAARHRGRDSIGAS